MIKQFESTVDANIGAKVSEGIAEFAAFFGPMFLADAYLRKKQNRNFGSQSLSIWHSRVGVPRRLFTRGLAIIFAVAGWMAAMVWPFIDNRMRP